jgi:uncharacterized membrane protein
MRRFMLEKGRLEAFSDGVIAVIITIMVLELKAPHGGTLADLVPVIPTFLAYVLSFANVGIYWNNHHHMLRAAGGINGRVMWTNLHLLFWLSLIPFTTNWVGEYRSEAVPTALYGFVLFCCGGAYALLSNALLAAGGKESTMARAVGSGVKERISLVCYIVAIAAAFVATWISDLLYVAVAVMWFIPDRRIERALAQDAAPVDLP